MVRQLEHDMTLPPIERKNRILIWTAEMDAYVDYWRDRRKSFGWIADQLDISRCAIIGRTYRRKNDLDRLRDTQRVRP